MENILIIKTGAAGDVVRTTSLLNVLAGKIYWVIDDKNKLLLPDNRDLTVLSVAEAFQSLKNINFDRVISLEEDNDCAKLASGLKSNELSGIYLSDDKINYTDNSACWFDMSRVSRLSLSKANELKAENTRSYQFYIFKMAGEKFNGEPYQVFKDNTIKTTDPLIGIEKRTGKLWPDKQWWGYDEVIHRLERQKIPVKLFEQRNNIRDYLRDIAGCSYIVSGDTLAMHVALAYKKNCTAVFNCTSPQEIYDYGLLKKVVSPLLNKYFYSSSYDEEVVRSVSPEEVYRTLPLNR